MEVTPEKLTQMTPQMQKKLIEFKLESQAKMRKKSQLELPQRPQDTRLDKILRRIKRYKRRVRLLEAMAETLREQDEDSTEEDDEDMLDHAALASRPPTVITASVNKNPY